MKPEIKQFPVTVGIGIVSQERNDERHIRIRIRAGRQMIAEVEMSATAWAHALMGVADQEGVMDLRDAFSVVDGVTPDWVKRKQAGGRRDAQQF